ncbi:LPS assembly lipoprotein LptE [Vibrio neonatus]|nr:LPS assembly lipoprotein LptE [Vibrio neonatus]
MIQIARLPYLRLAIALLFASLLSGCGFHLRGNYLVPEEVGAMSLTSYDDYSRLTRDVTTELRNNDIDLVTPAANVTNLHLLSESISDRTLSLYQNSRAAEKEIKLVVTYRVIVPEVYSRTFTTQVSRSYLDNPLTALAKSVEQEMLENEMRKQASRQIIRQLARLRNSLDNEDSQQLEVNEEGMVVDPSLQKKDQISLEAEFEKSDPAPVKPQPSATDESKTDDSSSATETSATETATTDTTTTEAETPAAE